MDLFESPIPVLRLWVSGPATLSCRHRTAKVRRILVAASENPPFFFALAGILRSQNYTNDRLADYEGEPLQLRIFADPNFFTEFLLKLGAKATRWGG